MLQVHLSSLSRSWRPIQTPRLFQGSEFRLLTMNWFVSASLMVTRRPPYWKSLEKYYDSKLITTDHAPYRWTHTALCVGPSMYNLSACFPQFINKGTSRSGGRRLRTARPKIARLTPSIYYMPIKLWKAGLLCIYQEISIESAVWMIFRSVTFFSSVLTIRQ